jgi:L-arabinose 1-dehydrogenase [NAD(P)+]
VTVAITGAAGEVGRVVADAFDPAERQLFTHSEHDDVDSELLDFTDTDQFCGALEGTDVLIHTAWMGAPDDEWEDTHQANVEGVATALAAAVENGLDRVIFPSSNHVTGLYNRDDPSTMETMAADGTRAVDPEDPVRPDSFYAVSKVACEAMCRHYAERHDLEVVVLRVGWLMPAEELRDVQSGDTDRARFARAMWLSPRDCQALFGRAARATLQETPLVLNAVSRNAGRYLSLTETTLHLGYRPQDDAGEVVPSE